MEAATTYQKHNSFHDLHLSTGRKTNPAEQSARGQKILANYTQQNGAGGICFGSSLGRFTGYKSEIK